MTILDKLLPRTISFRSQLLIAVIVGVLFLALAVSITTAWLTSRDTRINMEKQGLQITANMARQSVLALLFESEENAQDAAEATLNFPDVEHVVIFNKLGNTLLDIGIAGDWQPALDASLSDEAILAKETPTNLHFITAVYSQADDEPVFSLEDESPASEHLGYVHVMMSKIFLNDAQKKIFIENISISLIFAAVMALLLRQLVNRITTPVKELSSIMQKAEEGQTQLFAPVRGPSEVAHMASTFNKMMSALEERDLRLRQHRDTLESEVALRTQELVMARDEALRISRHKSEFLANMSHELRTPMNAILGYTEMSIDELSGNHENAATVSDLKRVLKATDQLLAMIDNILDMAKIEAGKMELVVTPTIPDEIITSVVDTIYPLIKKNDNEFNVDIQIDVDEILIDGVKLRQILLNLLSNASKFTKEGTIDFRTCCNKDMLEIEIADTGIGMSAEQQAHIFDDFRQADMSTTRNYGGTGLGLSISQRFCQMMGGNIKLKSAPGEGSCFTITIPLPVEADTDTQSESAA